MKHKLLIPHRLLAPGETASSAPLKSFQVFVEERESLKREVGNAIINTKGTAVLPGFSVCNKYMGVY